MELDRCLCQWVCLDISVKGSACVEVGAQSRLGRVAKEMSLWALKSGSSVLHSQLHFLLIVCCAQEPSLPTAPLPLPLPQCLPPALLRGAGSFTTFTVQVNTPLLEKNHSVEFTSPAPSHYYITLPHVCSCISLFLVCHLPPSPE